MAVVSRVQTAGRGRRGRVWASPEGGLWMSVGVASRRPIGGVLSLRVGLALCAVVDAVLGDAGGGRARVKWPNDVLVDGRKLAGVLCERRGVGDGHVLVVGIGMNVNNDVARLPGGVAVSAVSLSAVRGAAVGVAELAGEVLAGVRRTLASAQSEAGLADAALSSGELAALLDRLHGLDRPISLRRGDGSVVSGVLAGIAPDGRLAIRDAGGSTMLVGEGELVEVERSDGAGG